jgi:HEAT repeat protein
MQKRAFSRIWILMGLLMALAGARPTSAQEGAATDLGALVAKIKGTGDAIESKYIDELVAVKTRASCEGLIECYKSMSTIWTRREILRRLMHYDGIAEAEQIALQHLTDVATESPERELRTAAIDTLGDCVVHGKDFLRMIVISRADDATREHALEKHVRLANKSDNEWYRELWRPTRKPAEEPKRKDPPKKRDASKKGEKEAEDAAAEEARKPGVILNNMRLAAFEQIAPSLSGEDLIEGARDGFYRIRMRALDALDSSGDKRAEGMAVAYYEAVTEHPEVRLTAARIVARLQGAKVAPDFIKRATSFEAPLELRRGLAEVLVEMREESVNKQLIGELGKGKTPDKLFTIWACKRLQDERVDKALIKLLQDKDHDVAVMAVEALAERKHKEAVPALQKLIGKGRNRDLMRASLAAQSVLRIGDQAWIGELLALIKSDDPELRNLAITALGETKDKSFLKALVAALEDPSWTVRSAALQGLEGMRSKDAIDAIVARMDKEDGRLRHDFANTLWRLTGQPFQEDAEGWENWWKNSRERFQILTDEQLAKVKTGEDEYRLKQTTYVKSDFFGIRIVSHRVMFIVDVSGSMNEGLLTEYQGKAGQSRMEVAKGELGRCVGSLDPAAFFNIVTFSSGAEKWVDGTLAAASEKNRGEAQQYIERLGAGGGTNLYGALKLAFEDPDVDTIFVMSDGEPSMGEVTDPGMIREHVAAWNQNRGIVINTIAVGGQFQILEWLAQDNKGTHLKYE